MLPNPFRQLLASIWEVVEVVVIAVFTVFLIRTFLLQPFLVSGASMEPNFSDGDYLFVDRLSYRLRPPLRGEIVVFRYPQDPSTFFIKRIIGLPGETVHVGNGLVSIVSTGGEMALHEPYLPPNRLTAGSFSTTLDAGEYFVMGDNRDFSFDSRNWGALPRVDMIGIVRLRVFPFNAFGATHVPQYGN